MSDYLLYLSGEQCGNSLLFWKRDCRGYTTSIDQAHVFTKEEAFAQHRMRETDIPITFDEAEMCCTRQVSIETLNRHRREADNGQDD